MSCPSCMNAGGLCASCESYMIEDTVRPAKPCEKCGKNQIYCHCGMAEAFESLGKIVKERAEFMSSKKCYHCGREAGIHGRPDIYHTESCPTRSFAAGENVQMVKMTHEQAQVWEHMGAALARGPVEIGYHEIMEIKTLAHQKLLQAPVPKSAVDDVRAWYLMEALSRFLESKGIKPPFKMKE